RRRRNRTFPHVVHAAAIEISPAAGCIRLTRESLANGHFFPQTLWLIREDARAADLIVQETAGGERIVSDHFRRKPEAGPSRQQPILRVSFQELRRDAR